MDMLFYLMKRVGMAVGLLIMVITFFESPEHSFMGLVRTLLVIPAFMFWKNIF